jgi:hypothetical protein
MQVNGVGGQNTGGLKVLFVAKSYLTHRDPRQFMKQNIKRKCIIYKNCLRKCVIKILGLNRLISQ